MKMKKIVLVLTMALMGMMVMNAQPPRRPGMSPEQMVEKRVERLDKQLGLTVEQKSAITSILNEEQQAMQREKPARMEKGEKPDEATMQARRSQMAAQREATDAKIEAVLTPEQAAKFAEMKKQAGQHKHDKGRRDHHGDVKKGSGKQACSKDCTCKDK